MTPSKANPGKNLEIEVDGVSYLRYPIKTHVIQINEDLKEVVRKYAVEAAQDGDWFFLTEKMVAAAQGRCAKVDDIKARPLATWLSKRVVKVSYGVGLGMPESMEMALREVGTPRILFAAAVSVVSKLFGRTGDFYRVAGKKARGIDGPGYGTIPPYDEYVVLTAARPYELSRELKEVFAEAGKDVEVLIIDINDIGGNVLGSTFANRKQQEALAQRVLADNPHGQGEESTPIGLVRIKA